jgi:pyruvate,water dikinase
MTTEPTAIPAPTDFPIEWSDPADEQLFWFQDVLHFPLPQTPLNATLFQTSFEIGASAAISQLSMPIAALRTSVQNGYLYLGPVPVFDEPEAMEQRFAEMQRLTMELGPTVLQDWRETFEPRVLELADGILAFDYAGSSTREVAAFVGTFKDALVEVWDVHMRVNIPTMNAVFGLEEFLGHILGEDAVPQARQLLQGFPNKSTEFGRALWSLTRWIRSTDGLADAVLGARVRGGEVELGEHAAAGEFHERFGAFLDEFGWRSDVFAEVGHPTWREDPSTPLTELKDYIRLDDAADPFAAHERQAEERDALTAELEERLPEEARPQFRGMLPMAQQYLPIAEDHNFTIDQKFSAVVRHGVLQLGDKLVADGAVGDREDVCYLTLEEIVDLGQGADTSGLADLVRERRQAFLRQRTITPPPAIGTPPPPDMPPDPLVTKFFGLGVQQDDDPTTVTGYPASSGAVTGVAKVVKTLDEAGKLEAGDVLVCRMTMPAWTPLFGVVGAVVSDSGGPLSHCAIVAREYGIPCVAGTQVGTSMIEDGMRVRVDGSTGIVQILG